MTEVRINIKPDYPTAIAYYSVLEDKVVVNARNIWKKGTRVDKSHTLFKKSLQERFVDVVSHEIIHAVLDKYVSENASIAFDTLTTALWKKGISIATNRKW